MSEVKVNKISPRTNCGTTTLGDSGDSFVIPSGVTITNNGTQTGFGRSGSVNWQTTPKTATFTAVNGEGYFINSGSSLTMNLPAGSAGAIVAVSDYARNFATYNFTIAPNGSEKIGGTAQAAVLSVNGQAATFVYVDSTKGWVNVQNAEDTETGVPPFIKATGGTITDCGDFRIHTFTSPGTFQVTQLATQSPAPIYNLVSYTVVGGGGGTSIGAAPAHAAGGGGAGGFREGKNAPVDSYTASPLNAPAGLPVSVTSYPITVGGGGSVTTNAQARGGTGNPSVFSTITSAGGGGGAGSSYCGSGPQMIGGPGGSGGGGSSQSPSGPGPGNQPPVSPPQGNNGGSGTDSPPDTRAGGGGGATVAGCAGSPGSKSGNGGAGATTNITGSPVAYAGGGGGGASGPAGQQSKGLGGAGGGGDGGCNSTAGEAGGANLGGGAGGGKGGPPGASSGNTGGSGIVIIRYKFQ